mgnify:CR=1 FL=1
MDARLDVARSKESTTLLDVLVILSVAAWVEFRLAHEQTFSVYRTLYEMLLLAFRSSIGVT